MPSNKPRYSLTVDGRQRTVEADKFNDNIDAFVSQMPDATVRMKGKDGKEADVKLSDLSSAYDHGYDYVTTEQPIFVRTEAPGATTSNRAKATEAPAGSRETVRKTATAPATQQPGEAPTATEPGILDRMFARAAKQVPQDNAFGVGMPGYTGFQPMSTYTRQQAASEPQPSQSTPRQIAPHEHPILPAQKATSDGDTWRDQPITIGYLTRDQRKTTQGAVADQMYAEFENYYNNLKLGENKPTAIRWLSDRAWDYNIDEGDENTVVVTPNGSPYKEGNSLSGNMTVVKYPDGELQQENSLGNSRANALVNQVLAQFLQDKAEGLAKELAAKIPPSVGKEDGLDALRENYYNKDYQNRLWEIANKAGVDYKAFVQDVMKPVLSRTISATHNGLQLPVNALFSDWDYAARAGKEYDPEALNDDERRLYEALMQEFDRKLASDEAQAHEKSEEVWARETASNLAIGGREARMMQGSVPLQARRTYNAYADPSKAIDHVLDKLYSKGKSGGSEGAPLQDNIDRQRVGNLLYRKIVEKLVAERVPQSKWGYVLSGIADSDIGELFKNYLQTDFERHLDNLAQSKYAQSLEGFTGMLASGGHEATKFLGDAWEYYGGGKVGGLLAGSVKRRAVRGLAHDLVERGVRREVAEGIARRVFQQTSKKASTAAVMGALHGAGTMGSAQAVSGALRQSITPAGGAKLDEIQSRRANGEEISHEQEAREIAEANREAHSLSSIAGQAGQAGLSGAVAGLSFGLGTYAGTVASKWASKYMGDLASAATGYVARLNTNAASVTALGQVEGAIAGERPEGSVANQFAQNLVTFAMLDAQNVAPRWLNGHPIKTWRDWKERQRQMEISEADQNRMREAGYGDLIDTIDGLVSERFRGTGETGVSITDQGRRARIEQEGSRVNEGMLKMLADPALPEELKRKYYTLVTGDSSRQLSPIIASEVTKDEAGNHYLVTYNKGGYVVSDRQYRSEKAAKEAQRKIGHEQDENLTEALQQTVFAKDADAVLEDVYRVIADAYANGQTLTEGQRRLLHLCQNRDKLSNALQAMNSGEPLAESDQRLVQIYMDMQGYLYSHDGNIESIKHQTEASHGLATHGLATARKGHSEKEAHRIATRDGEEAVHVGGDVWRTQSEETAVKDYQRRLYDFLVGKGGSDADRLGLESQPAQSAGGAESPAGRSNAGLGAGEVKLPQTEGPQANEVKLPQEGDRTTLQQRRDAGYARGLSIDADETRLAQMQYDNDLANERFNQAFADGQLSQFKNGVVQAVENDDVTALQQLFDQYADRLSDEQKEATYGLIENIAVREGVNDSIASQTMAYQDERQKELSAISDSDGNITEMTLNDGRTVYYKSGDLTNQYGGVIAVDDDGNAMQVPVSTIESVEHPAKASELLDNDTNAFAEGLKQSYQQIALGRVMLPGQEANITIGGQHFHIVMDRELPDGNYQLTLDDGSAIVVSPDELEQGVSEARKSGILESLSSATLQREQREQEERLRKGIVGYAEGNPDYSNKGTDAAIAGQYLRQQDESAGKKSADTLQSLQEQQEALKAQERQARFDLERQRGWMEINGDTYTPEDKAEKEKLIARRQQEIADLQQRQRKLGAVRNSYMTPSERQKFQSDRRKESDKARKDAVKFATQHPQHANAPEGISSKELLEHYATQAEAEDFLRKQREDEMKQYRDGAGRTMAEVQNVLRDYVDGLLDLNSSELLALHSQLLEAEEAERLAMEAVRQIKGAQGRLPITYKERNQQALEEMEPAERRAAIISKAKDYGDLLKKAKEAYKDSPIIDRLDEPEPETLEEYVSQNIGYGQFNWEGTGQGISRKRGLQEELGLKRGIGRNYDSNGINAYLAPKGQGKSVDEVAHDLWEGASGTPFEHYGTQDMRNAILDLFSSMPSARAIKELLLRHRIDELESYARAQEEQERWYQEQEEEEVRRRQEDIEVYNAYLDSTAQEAVPTEEAEDYLNGLYAEEMAEAEEEARDREEAWQEHLAEREISNDNNNESESRRENETGPGLDRQSEQPAVHAGNGEGEAPLRAEEPHQPHAQAQHNAQGRANTGAEAAQTGSGTTDRSVLVSGREVKLPHVDFATETEEQSKAFEERIPKMTDEELLGYIAQDSPDVTKQYHPALGDEYDYRHSKEEHDYYNFYEPMLDEEYSKGGREAVEDTYNKAWQDWVNGGYASAEDRTKLSAQINACEEWLAEHDKENTLGATDAPEKVEAERQVVNTDPTEAQKEAGNYKKGHIKVDGYDISIENPKGSTRSGKDANFDASRSKQEKTPSRKTLTTPLSNQKADGVTLPSNGVSEGKDKQSSSNKQEKGKKSYTIEPYEYRTKRGRVLNMHLVKFAHELSQEEKESVRSIVKEDKGWWSRNDGGYLMRSEEGAKKLGEALFAEKAVDKPLVQVSPVKTAGEAFEEAMRRLAEDKKNQAEKVWESLVKPNKLTNFAEDPEGQAKWVEEHIDEIVEAYMGYPDHGNKLDPDEMRKAFAGMGYNGKNVPQFRKQESKVLAKLYMAMLRRAVSSGNTSITILTGAGGAGKSTATERMNFSDRGVVFDSALNSFGSLKDKIEIAKQAGMKDFRVVAVYNDAPKAFENTLTRGKRSGRFLSLEYFTDAFKKNQGKIAKLQEEYPDIDIVCIDNSNNDSATRPNHGVVSVDEAKKWDYTINDETLNKLLDLYEDGINEGRFTNDEIASIGQRLQDIGGRPGDQFDTATLQRIRRLSPSIQREEGGDLRPGTSGQQPLVRRDGIHQSGGERPGTQREAAEGSITPDTAEGSVNSSEASNQPQNVRGSEAQSSTAEQVDQALDDVNHALSLVGTYTADHEESEFNESLGYSRTAEAKALKDAEVLAKKLGKALGLNLGRKKIARANIAPIGGDVTFDLPLTDTRRLKVVVNLDRDSKTGNLTFGYGYYRVESTPYAPSFFGTNYPIDKDTTLESLVSGIHRAIKYGVEDFALPSEEGMLNAVKAEPKKTKSSKKAKKQEGDLFGDLFADVTPTKEDTKNNNNGKDNTEDTGEADSTSGTDRPLGPVRPSGNGVLGPSKPGQPDTGAAGGNPAERSGLANGQQSGLSADGSRGSAESNANSAGTSTAVGSGRGHGVSTGVRQDGEGSTDRGADSRPGAAERPERIPARSGANASGSDRGKGTERANTPEEGTGVRGNVETKPAHDEATSTTRADDGSEKTANERNAPLTTRNYLYPKNGEDIDNMSAKERLVANVDALETIVKLIHENRTANADERNILGKFRGWGGIDLTSVWDVEGLLKKNASYDWRQGGYVVDKNSPYYRLGKVVKALDPDGKRGVFNSIKQSALTSYYTPLPIAGAMNWYLSLAGYKGGGSMLDPSIGNGVFEGTMPKDMQQRTQIYGIELDWLTAQIAKNLYPDAHVQQAGYQEANVGAGAYDIVESNIPFGSIKVYDPSWRHDSTPAKKAAQGKIHTYFALKMMESAKPGGLVTIMTSNSIMDTPGNNIIRTALAEQGEFLGAVRLPDNTFKGAGTRVVTDVIFMRKYKDETDRENTLNREGYVDKQNQFLSVGNVKAHNSSEDKDYDVRLNLYYQANPKMMLGTVVAGGQYRSDEFGLTSPDDTKTLAKKMRERIKGDIVGDRAGQLYDTRKTEREIYHAIREAYVGDGTYQGSGNLVEQNGKFGVLKSSGDGGSLVFEENPALHRQAARIRLYIPVRTALKKLIAAQINREADKVIDGYRKELNDAYKRFRSYYGLLNDKKNNFIDEDIDSYQMRGLEDIDAETKQLKGLADIFTKNTIKPSIDTSKVNDPTSAIATSLAQYGEIRPSFMESVLGRDWAKLCDEALYKVPFSESYVVSDDYLSGDVKSKLEDAKRASSQNPGYKRNVEALEKVQPRDIPIGEINIRMGARWVPDKVYTDFMKKMFGIPDWDSIKSGVRYVPEADDYIITVDNSETGGEADKWATDSRTAKQIFEAAMKDKSIKVLDHHSDGSTTVNKEKTELANSKVQDLRETFETWVSSDPERGEMLEKMYNDKFNRTVIRQWNAPFLNPVGLQGMSLRPHQKAAVWMLLNNRGGIVDHIVGAGKTLVMQSAIMEMRRMGIAKKPMIIALKATVGQIAKEFAQAYPAAKILAPSEKDFEEKNRKKIFAKIATNDYDCVIISHDNYCKFSHSKEIESQTLNEQIQQLEAAIMLMHSKDDEDGSTQLTKRQIKGLETRKANLEAQMQKVMDRPTDKEFCFENLGVDYLFVDECQRFKSLPYATTYNQVAGLGDPKGSTRAVALLNGVRYLQKLHQGDRGTVFLSGTTITNSLVEVYNLLNYLRPNMMKKLGYTTFDAWAAQFAVRSTELEYGVTNELKEKNRFRYFQNVSELGKMYAEIADVRNDYNLKLPKPKANSRLVTIDPSPELEEINDEIVNMVKNKNGEYFGIVGNDKTPWSLRASTLSSKASVSTRLIDPSLPDDPHGKIATACENVAKIYKKFDAQKGTQLIFCDAGVPGKDKSGKTKEYDAYTDIINRLVNDYGIPRKEIADIHTANSDDKRKALFKKVRDGQVRILIGGTVNMGTGVNVQPRLVALHHIDIPWQPADTEQRNGRGVRQGNIIARDFNNNQVDIFYYAVKGTLDTYRYQLQDIKGKMFAQFKLNTIDSNTSREFDEGEMDADGGMDPAEMVAMLSGNPVIFEKSKQDKLVKKLRRQESAEYNDYLRRKRNIESLKRDKEHYETFQNMNERDRHFLERNGYTPGTPANDYKIVDGEGNEYPWKKATDAGKIIHKLYKQAKPFFLKGYGMKAHVVQSGDDIFGFQLDLKPVEDKLGRLSGLRYSVPVSDTDQAAGQAFGNLVRTIYRNGEVYQAELDKINHKLEGSGNIGEFQFSKQKQLDEALAKKKELDEQYKKLSDDVDDKPKEGGEPQGEQDSGDDGVMYRMADDEESAALDKEPTVKVYRAMQLINGKLYPPMMAEVKGNLVEPRELGQWEIADERPGIIKEIKKNKQGEEIGYVDLNKGSRDATGKKATPTKGVAYNPYWHTSRSPLNDQFASAWIRPNIVTVEVEVPVSELTSGYRAKYAKDPVGETEWHSGSVTKQLTAQGHAPRKVILSRYDKPVRVLSAAETADRIVDFIQGYDVVIPENVVTPQVRAELEKRGVKIGPPEKRYKKTEQIREAIARGLTVTNDLLREQEVFKDGETLPISNRNRGYGVEGLNNDYRSLPELLDAFRVKYPDYVAKIVETNYGNPAIKVEPWRKYLTARAGQESAALHRYTERQRQRAEEAVNAWARKLNLGDKITVITDDSKLTGKQAKAKGWFDPKTGKITIVLPKHASIDDVVRTLLHEGVAHYGLRELFGDKFDTFLDNVWNNASVDVKGRLERLAIKYDGNQRKATEEYLSRLAEDTDFDRAMESGWWNKIKNFFIGMLAKAGIRLKHLLTDNDLRYILWRSYQNIEYPGKYRNEAKETAGVEPIDDIDPIDVIEGHISAAEPMPRRGSAAREHTEAEKLQMQRAAEAAGEALGGVKVSVERNGHDGIKGSYNTEDDTVHVNIDEADDAEDIQATVSHEVLGHEGLKALLGSNKAVDAFGVFIYDNAGKALRKKIVERASEEGYEWDDPLRYSKAAQEVFSDIASEGPANADEFSLWRKVKHYVIQAAKKLGLHIQGLMNDHDLRYYVLKTGKAVKTWTKLSDADKAEAADPGRTMYARRGKPKQKKGESMAHYIQRLRDYEMWKNAEQKSREANDPLPERETFEKKFQEEFNKAMDDWRKQTGIEEGADRPGAFPKRKDGETPQEYAIRVADYESELDKWETAPNVFDYLKKGEDEYRKAYEEWKVRYDIQEMEDADEQLYGEPKRQSSEPEVEEEHYKKMEIDAAVDKDLGDAVGVDTGVDGARRQAKLAVIERRKNLESASAEDAIFIHDLCKDIDTLAKEMGIAPKELRRRLIHVIERPVAQQEAEAEVSHWVDIFNKMRAIHDAHTFITVDGVKFAAQELGALCEEYYKYGETPDTHEGRRSVHTAAVALADKFNEYYADTTGYNRLYGDDIMQVGKYIHKMAQALTEASSVDRLADDERVKAIVDRIHDWYDNFFHVIEDAGLRGDAGYIAQGYINHIWDKEKSDAGAWSQYVENYQRTRSANMRHREIATYLDGMEVGLVAKFDDVAQIMSYYSRQNNEAIANKKFLDDLSFLTISETNEDGEVVRTLPVLNSHKPSKFDEERYKMYHVPGVGDVWVLKEVSSRFASIFGTMRTQDAAGWLGKLGKGYDLLGGTMKKIQLSISGFHMGALSEVALAQMRPDRGMKSIFKYILWDAVKHNGEIPAYAHPEDFKFAASHLVQLGATQDYAAADVNMITEKFRSFVKGLRNDEAFMKKVAGNTLNPFAVALDWINKGMDKLLWNYLHDGLKIACFKHFAEQIDRKVEKDGLTAKQRDRLLDEAGQYVNDTFGGQYWELLNVSPATLKWLRRAFLSPDWLISTQRHFFANFGFGSLYDPRGFSEYLKEQLPFSKSASSTSSDGDIYRQFRIREARLCYVLGVCVFFYTMMNALNAVVRAWDKEKEEEKASEARKTNPDYKSPYELAYPNGMKWYDYTMFGNTLGQQTHLFLGRYEDGTEMYVRWGKQFREFPELFIGRKGLDFPAPMIQRMMGKANPVIGLTRDNLGALGIWGFDNQNDIEEIQAKYGKTIGLLAMNARHFLPFSLPTQADKEFKMIDLFMPSSKGFTRYKTVDYFKDFIKSGDMEGVVRVYRAATMNGIDAEQCLTAAISTLRAEQRDEMRDGVTDLATAVSRYDSATTLQEKKTLRNKLIKYLASSDYKAFTRGEALQMVEDYQNGTNVAERDNDRYIKLSTSDDVREDYRLNSIGKQAKKYVSQIRTAQRSGDSSKVRQLAHRYDAWLHINSIANHARTAVNKLKKQLGHGDDAAVMQQIRQIRKQAQKDIDAIPAPQ